MLDVDAVGQAEWQRVHEALTRLAKKRAGLDYEEGRWLCRAHAARVHERLGYGSGLAARGDSVSLEGWDLKGALQRCRVASCDGAWRAATKVFPWSTDQASKMLRANLARWLPRHSGNVGSGPERGRSIR